MTEPPDSHDLAKRFLDLWQDQVTAMATDPDLADGLRRWQALWLGQGGLGQDLDRAPTVLALDRRIVPRPTASSPDIGREMRSGTTRPMMRDIRGSGDPLETVGSKGG